MSRLVQWPAFAGASTIGGYALCRVLFANVRLDRPQLAGEGVLHFIGLAIVLTAWHLAFAPKKVWDRILDSIDLREGYEDFPWHIPLIAGYLLAVAIGWESVGLVVTAGFGLWLEWFTFRLLLRESQAAPSARGFVSAFVAVRLATAYAVASGGWRYADRPNSVVALAATEGLLLAIAVSVATRKARAAGGHPAD